MVLGTVYHVPGRMLDWNFLALDDFSAVIVTEVRILIAKTIESSYIQVYTISA